MRVSTKMMLLIFCCVLSCHWIMGLDKQKVIDDLMNPNKMDAYIMGMTYQNKTLHLLTSTLYHYISNTPSLGLDDEGLLKVTMDPNKVKDLRSNEDFVAKLCHPNPTCNSSSNVVTFINTKLMPRAAYKGTFLLVASQTKVRVSFWFFKFPSLTYLNGGEGEEYVQPPLYIYDNVELPAWYCYSIPIIKKYETLYLHNIIFIFLQ